jgi:hypothetical protein
VVEELRCGLGESDAAAFDAISRDILWPHALEHGGRVLIAGHDPLLPPPNRVVMVAYPEGPSSRSVRASYVDPGRGPWRHRVPLDPDTLHR